MVKQGSENCPVTKGRRRPFVVVGSGAFHSKNRVMYYGIMFTEVLEKRRDRSKFAPDSAGSKVTLFEIGTSGKQVRSWDYAHFFWLLDVEKSG